MTTIATITTSLDGFVAGLDDRPGQGLGVGGERLHYWVFGGPWTYASPGGSGPRSEVDEAWYQTIVGRVGAVVVGRGMYDAAGAWGGENPWASPAYVLTHRVEDGHDESFTFVADLAEALGLARETAGEKDVSIGGGADVIRQALGAREVDELWLSIAPITLGAGRSLFDGMVVDLEPLEVRQSRWATHVRYAVRP